MERVLVMVCKSLIEIGDCCGVDFYCRKRQDTKSMTLTNEIQPFKDCKNCKLREEKL
jgi:hypothetical protein